MSGYIGTQPVPQATQTRDAFTCTAGQTSFATSGYTPSFLDVYLNGIKLAAADYTASNGSDVVLASGAALNDILEVVAYSSFEVVTDTVTKAGTVLNLDRTGSDGTILDLKKDGSTVGSIGTYANEYYHGSAVGGDTFLRYGYSAIVPATSSGANRDAAINLGASNNRFKDLYLSGGVYLGGTGSANKLDDYEEGSYTATLTPSTSGTVTAGANTLRYSKVGRLVTVTGYMAVHSVSSPLGVLKISLPFTCLTSDSGASVKVNNVNSAVLSDFWSIVIPATNYISIYMGSTTSVGSYAAQQFKAGTDMRISVTYTVA